MDQVRLEVRDLLPQDRVVVFLQRVQAVDFQPGMPVHAMDVEAPVDMRFLGRGAAFHSVVGGQDPDVMPAGPQVVRDVPAADLIASDLVGRIQVGKDKDFHASRGAGGFWSRW
ncbi:hypothetical protein llg_43020 [Luteolibacter sp. LG18]|nr:hypothetical protein llg_43020 [Luteolibacter sp. LG18]